MFRMSTAPAVHLSQVFSRADALALGLTDLGLAGLVRRGELTRLRRGLYARSGPDDPESRAAEHVAEARAGLRRRSAGHAISHLSAAAVFGLPLPLGPAGFVHLTVVAGTPRSRRSPRTIVHHCDSGPTPTTCVDGLEVTTVARTAADCLRLWGARVSVPIVDAALRAGLVTPDEILTELDGQRRWRGRPRAFQTLPLVDGRRESWLESYAFTLLSEWGLETPTPQLVVLNSRGRFLGRVDGGWLGEATVLELDGRGKYADRPDEAWAVEKNRYDAMGNLGLERVRFGLDDLLRRPQEVRTDIRDRRASGSAARFSGRFVVPDPTGLTFSPVLATSDPPKPSRM